MMNAHLAGGDGGIEHVLDHFAPTLKEPWTRLTAPEFTDELKRRIVEGCEREALGHGVAELIAERDRCLVRLLQARDECRKALAAYLGHTAGASEA
jgi:carnitine 3-dehydrogenase